MCVFAEMQGSLCGDTGFFCRDLFHIEMKCCTGHSCMCVCVCERERESKLV